MLRIPMRGYERQIRGGGKLILPRYESPCGVMSLTWRNPMTLEDALRIPMRGYEGEREDLINELMTVTNPHAGL